MLSAVLSHGRQANLLAVDVEIREDRWHLSQFAEKANVFLLALRLPRKPQVASEFARVHRYRAEEPNMLTRYNKHKLLGLAIFSTSAAFMFTLTLSALVLVTAGCGKNAELEAVDRVVVQAAESLRAASAAPCI